jgi:hypothetical protein
MNARNANLQRLELLALLGQLHIVWMLLDCSPLDYTAQRR